MTTDDQNINQIIIASIFDPNCHIREHMADIIGDKKLYSAHSSLLKQLEIEENYFTISSIIEAIGKIGDFTDIKHIIDWTTRHISKIISEHQYFLLKHIYQALCRLDNTSDSIYSSEFFNQYEKYMNDYIIN